MKGTLDRATPRRALEVALIYAALGVLWIVITDALVERRTIPPGFQHFLQSWKGSLFVVATATMLYLLLRHIFSRIAASQRRIERLLSQLRSLASYERRSREAERTRIARDLHDELGQQLTGLKFDVAGISAGVTDGISPEIRLRLAALSDALDESIRTVRRLSTELRPGVLDQLGLAAALEWLANEHSRRTGMRGTVEVADGAFPDEIATAMFRLVQESLTNIARHSCATEFSILLSRRESEILLTVRDNGLGYSAERTGFGVLGMRERVAAFGGLFEIGVGPDGTGTEVRSSFPLIEHDLS